MVSTFLRKPLPQILSLNILIWELSRSSDFRALAPILLGNATLVNNLSFFIAKAWCQFYWFVAHEVDEFLFGSVTEWQVVDDNVQPIFYGKYRSHDPHTIST